MIQVIFWGALVRVVQSIAQSAPTILIGLLVAGVLRYFLRPANTRRFFGGTSWRSLPQAWLIGMLLPVCSLGVVPCVRELRRSGLTGGTILAFALAAPLFNPLSILYGLTLSKPFMIFACAICSLFVVMVIGLAFDRIFNQTARPPIEEPHVEHGIRRMLAVLVSAGREITGATAGYTLIGVLGVALLCGTLPQGVLQRSMNDTNPLAPLVMAAIAIPAYVTPMNAMSQLGSMFQHGNSVGAAFTLLALGAGANLGLIAWMYRTYRIKPATTWLAMLITVVIVLAYCIDRPLKPLDVEPSDHTHAFDVFTNPLHASDSNPAATAIAKMREATSGPNVIALATLGTIVLFGVLLRCVDRWWSIDAWLTKPVKADPSDRRMRGDVNVPVPVLGVVILIGVIAFSVVSCYAYFPNSHETFEEMQIARAEALTAANIGNVKVAEHWIAVFDDWSRKLQVGVYIRTGKLTEYQQIKARILRDKLELLEHEVQHGDKEAVKELIKQVNDSYRRLHGAYPTSA